MIIIGDKIVKFEPFNEIKSMSQISKFDNLLFNFDRQKIILAQNFNKIFSVRTNNINEILIANAAGAKFIVVNCKTAKTAQELAEKYLFDAKIAVYLHFERNLKKLAQIGVDAAILSPGINRVDSTVSAIASKFKNLKLPNLLKFKKNIQK